MFADLLRDHHRTLYDQAVGLGIDLAPFEGLSHISEAQALKALRGVVAEQERTSYRRNPVDAFVHENRSELQRYLDTRNELARRIAAFNTRRGVVLKLNLQARTIEQLVFQGRAPKGSRKRPVRDMATFAQQAREAGYATKLRLRPSDTEDYETGELTPQGTIRAGDKTFLEPKDWMNTVYEAALERGTRETKVGNPWKAVQIRDQDENWITLDRAYQRLMGEPAEADDDDEFE